MYKLAFKNVTFVPTPYSSAIIALIALISVSVKSFVTTAVMERVDTLPTMVGLADGMAVVGI